MHHFHSKRTHSPGNCCELFRYVNKVLTVHIQTWFNLHTRTHIRTHIRTYVYTYMHTYIFVVNLDALAQASDIKIERRQVVFLCWMQDLNPGPQTPNRQQTECSLTNQIASRLNARWQTDWAVGDRAIKLELHSPSLWSANIQPTRPRCQLAFTPGSGDIDVCCC